MKFLIILLVAVSFNISALAQEHAPEAPGKPTEEMVLVGKDSGKPMHVEDKNKEKKHSEKNSKKKQKAKKDGQ